MTNLMLQEMTADEIAVPMAPAPSRVDAPVVEPLVGLTEPDSDSEDEEEQADTMDIQQVLIFSTFAKSLFRLGQGQFI